MHPKRQTAEPRLAHDAQVRDEERELAIGLGKEYWLREGGWNIETEEQSYAKEGVICATACERMGLRTNEPNIKEDTLRNKHDVGIRPTVQ